MVFNDTLFNRETIHATGGKYDYFNYRDVPTRSSAFYERVMDLCSRCILRDPMGADKRLVDIFGYTPDDLFAMDYASLIDIEDRLNTIEKDHDKSMSETTKKLEDDHKALQTNAGKQ